MYPTYRLGKIECASDCQLLGLLSNLNPGAAIIGSTSCKQTLENGLTRMTRKANVSKIFFHDLRHTAATLLLAEGVHPNIALERRGHSDITTPFIHYARLTPYTQVTAASALLVSTDVVNTTQSENKRPRM